MVRSVGTEGGQGHQTAKKKTGAPDTNTGMAGGTCRDDRAARAPPATVLIDQQGPRPRPQGGPRARPVGRGGAGLIHLVTPGMHSRARTHPPTTPGGRPRTHPLKIQPKWQTTLLMAEQKPDP